MDSFRSLPHAGVMKVKTEQLLNLLLWSADKLMRPTFRNLTNSYESWAYQNGLHRQLATLENGQLIESQRAHPRERVYRLTAAGRLQALGGRDPETRWSRHWDGRWRLVLFDVPVARDSHRKRLRRYLHERGFGCLQGSVWITPDSMEEEKQLLLGAKVDVASLLLLDARPCAGESDAEIVAGAWDFDHINRRYVRLMRILDAWPNHSLRSESAAKAVLRWAGDEHEAWLDAVTHDPLLPQRLLPSGYLGQAAWQRRVEVLRKAGAQLQSFSTG
jgi:phenylacetic acid degradation operon negative regulatory protein